MTVSTLPPGVSNAPPLWALSAEHSAARIAAVRRLKAAEGVVAGLVTMHTAPYDGDPVTASARTLERLATASGMTTRMHIGLEGCALEGRVVGQRLGFRASWRRGKADGALWFEPELRTAMVADTRPVVVAKLTHTALAGKRAAGVDERHLAILGGPYGVVVPMAELTKRVRACGNG